MYWGMEATRGMRRGCSGTWTDVKECRGALRGAIGHRVIQMGTEVIMEGCRWDVVGCKGECGEQRDIQCGMEMAERVHSAWCSVK